jgi:carbonic anhydrase/acetyltransferase-like protein (isoleucine patch superfamily)
MIKKYKDVFPQIAEDVFIAENAVVIGKVKIGRNSSVWYSAVIRGDSDSIEIGEGSSIQDNATIHCDEGIKTVIGSNVTIGHNAIVHGAKISDNVMMVWVRRS